MKISNFNQLVIFSSLPFSRRLPGRLERRPAHQVLRREEGTDSEPRKEKGRGRVGGETPGGGGGGRQVEPQLRRLRLHLRAWFRRVGLEPAPGAGQDTPRVVPD